MQSAELDVVAGILAVLRAHTGMDFAGYRRPTVERRIANRMTSLGVASHREYLELLRGSADEADRLLARIAIKVSQFYRNPEAFSVLRREIVPRLVREAAGAPLRVWCAGCGNGEEAYTLAMLLDEAGAPAAIEATDIDRAALDAAARGVYPVEAAQELPLDLAARYLAVVDDGARACVEVAAALRERVRFARHDLLFATLPTMKRFDLVSCRNVLIYLQAEHRREAFASLRAALRPGGVLFLGEAEWPPQAMERGLETLSQAARLFRAAAAA